MRMAEEGKTVYTRYYLGGNYEAHCDSSGTEERLYVGGDCYEAPALLVKKRRENRDPISDKNVLF